ncbi:hypothetical protein EU528_14005 [Candidatus Thorarchaeota archaeon]|nr:MAG: hypothetical protein EU528_14005 [Candidatus Thorarchaeota archaeon]
MNTIDLVRSFAPILHFHPDESAHCCFPSDAERIFQLYQSDWSRFELTKTPKTLDDSTPCYYEIWTDKSMTQIRYWFWYNYNDFPGTHFGIGDHLGDWEHVEVRLYGGLSTQNAVWLVSNHLKARLASLEKTLPGFDREMPILEDAHLHVWVALGSHANYPSPQSAPRCYAKIFCDKIRDHGMIWATANVLRKLDETNFRDFTGRWGDEKAPRGPANEYNNRWRNAPDIEPIQATSES